MSSIITTIGWSRISVECPTFSVGLAAATASLAIQASQDGVTFRRLKALMLGVTGGSTDIMDWVVSGSVGNFIAPVEPFLGYNYCKLEFSSVATAAALACKVHLHNQTF